MNGRPTDFSRRACPAVCRERASQATRLKLQIGAIFRFADLMPVAAARRGRAARCAGAVAAWTETGRGRGRSAAAARAAGDGRLINGRHHIAAAGERLSGRAGRIRAAGQIIARSAGPIGRILANRRRGAGRRGVRRDTRSVCAAGRIYTGRSAAERAARSAAVTAAWQAAVRTA